MTEEEREALLAFFKLLELRLDFIDKHLLNIMPYQLSESYRQELKDLNIKTESLINIIEIGLENIT